MKPTKLLLLTCLFYSFIAHSAELMGKLNGNIYTSVDNVFTTQIPSLEGELRDFPNAVSVYYMLTGSQDSLEFYPVPEQEQKKYQEKGPEAYHAEFIRKAFIKRRYEESFKSIDISIIDERSETINKNSLHIITIELPGGSQLSDSNGRRKNMWVGLGAVMQGEMVYVYQVAITDNGKSNIEDVKGQITEKIISWVGKTTFNG